MNIESEVQNLRQGIEGHSLSVSDIRKLTGDIISQMYRNHFVDISITDFFYPLLIEISYLRFENTNTQIINHLNEMLGKRCISMSNIPTTRREFINNGFDAPIITFNHGIRYLRSSEIGDIALFNVGILKNYHNSKRKVVGPEYYRTEDMKLMGKHKKTLQDITRNSYSEH